MGRILRRPPYWIAFFFNQDCNPFFAVVVENVLDILHAKIMVRDRSASNAEHHHDALTNPPHELRFVIVAVPRLVNDVKMFHMHILAVQPPRDLVYALLSGGPQVVQKLRRRFDRADRELIPRPGARDRMNLRTAVLEPLGLADVHDGLLR